MAYCAAIAIASAAGGRWAGLAVFVVATVVVLVWLFRGERGKGPPTG